MKTKPCYALEGTVSLPRRLDGFSPDAHLFQDSLTRLIVSTWKPAP